MKFGLGMGAMALGAVLLGAAPALAHHSFAMFDRDTKTVLAGTVHEFQWTNPHAFIEVDVPDGKGGSKRWGVEMNSPNNLKREGWKSNTVKEGDKVSVTVSPLRNGQPGGLFVGIKLSDGTTLGQVS